MKTKDRQMVIKSFKEWLASPDTIIEGVERFWKYNCEVLLEEIDYLKKRLDRYDN